MPGPAINGIARGVIATFALVLVVSEESFDVEILSASRLKPAKQIRIPPAIRRTSISRPKNFKTYSPTKKAMISIINTLIADHRATLFFSSGLSFFVSPRNTGRFPIGFNTENNVTNVERNKSRFFKSNFL